MALDDPADCGQAQTSACEIFLVVQAPKRQEQQFRIFILKAATVVADKIDLLAALFFRTELNCLFR
jgi:hypothetical protein